MPLLSALAIARTADRWVGEEIDLSEIEDLDAAADVLREIGDGGTTLLFVEEDDEYVAIIRVDGDGEPRIFLSDVRAVGSSALAERLFVDAAPIRDVDADDEDASGADDDEDDDEDAVPPEGAPGGDATLLEDLGTPKPALLALCAEEGMLPADVTYAVCEKAGCADVLEDLRIV